MYTISVIPTLADNLTYLIDNGSTAVVIDPGEASPVIRRLEERSLRLEAILNTHGHFDHTGGNSELVNKIGTRIADGVVEVVRQAEGTGSELQVGPFTFRAMWTPGHSDDSVSYYLAPTSRFQGAVFTGDTLFVGGCGRVFTRSPGAMWSSLQLLAGLPAETLVYCGHDYSLEDYEFAVTVEPDNDAVKARLEEIRSLTQSGGPAIPSTIGQERDTNPFLRAGTPEMKRVLGMPDATDVDAFTALRRLKDRF